MPERLTSPTCPGRWMDPGMMPTLASPGVVAPGQLGPTRRAPRARTSATTGSMSRAGMCSVMQKIVPMPASSASRMASGAAAAGTKMTLVSAPVAATAAAQVSKTGTAPSRAAWPPRPGVTPATTRVP